MRSVFKPWHFGALAVLTMTVLAVEVLILPTVVFGQTVVLPSNKCFVDRAETTPVSRFRIDEQADTKFPDLRRHVPPSKVLDLLSCDQNEGSRTG